MDQEPIPVEVTYVSLEPTDAERLKVGEIISGQQGNWEETFAGLPANLQEKLIGDPEYCPTDAVLDANLQNHGYDLPPEVRGRMYEDFARFLSDCGIPENAPDYPYAVLAEQFLGTRIESPMVISPVEPEEPAIDLYGEAGEPAPQSPPGIAEPDGGLETSGVLPSAEPVAGADQPKPAIEKLSVPSQPSREFALLSEVEIFTLADARTIELRGKITHGGYSDVYIGRYPGEETDTVVLKIAKDKEGMSEVRERFSSDVPNVEKLYIMYGEEAQILGDLRRHGYQFAPRVHYYHPGRRVNIYSGETDESNFFGDRPYIVMDLARGLNIDRLPLLGEHMIYKQAGEIMGSSIDEETALEIARQIAEAFDLTLKAGYSNQDIKRVAESIYWDPESKKITVTDWNEARYFRNEGRYFNNNMADRRWERTEERIYQDAKAEEIEYLWVTRRVLYYLLTGEELNTGLYGKRGVPVDKLDKWNFFTANGLISTGTQVILQRAFDRTNTYPDLASLKADLESQLAVLGVPGPEPAAGADQPEPANVDREKAQELFGQLQQAYARLYVSPVRKEARDQIRVLETQVNAALALPEDESATTFYAEEQRYERLVEDANNINSLLRETKSYWAWVTYSGDAGRDFLQTRFPMLQKLFTHAPDELKEAFQRYIIPIDKELPYDEKQRMWDERQRDFEQALERQRLKGAPTKQEAGAIERLSRSFDYFGSLFIQALEAESPLEQSEQAFRLRNRARITQLRAINIVKQREMTWFIDMLNSAGLKTEILNQGPTLVEKGGVK